MGDRGQILIEDTGVYLYTFYDAAKLDEILRVALIKGSDRWNDPEYLSRIIFQTMIGDDKSNIGYGIGTKTYRDVRRMLKVDCKKQKVLEHESGKKYAHVKSFTDFISVKPKIQKVEK